MARLFKHFDASDSAVLASLFVLGLPLAALMVLAAIIWWVA
jgi:hypothetical protein